MTDRKIKEGAKVRVHLPRNFGPQNLIESRNGRKPGSKQKLTSTTSGILQLPNVSRQVFRRLLKVDEL